MPVITSINHISNSGGLVIEEGPHVVDNLVVWFAIDNREGLVRKLCDNLVKGDHHRFDVKVSGIVTLG